MSEASSTAEAPSGPVVVGVGASAGGLEAFRALLRAVPERSGLAWVLIQHLDPAHESVVAELLAKETPMPVLQIRGETAVEPDRVYVIPPDAYVAMREGRLHLEEPVLERGLRLPIDRFFRSLAEEAGSAAVGVVLSGTGSDGTAGLREIRAAGGLGVVQEPSSAAHDGMPRSALSAGAVDLVQRLDEIPGAILAYLRHPFVRPSRRDRETADGKEDEIQSIIDLVRSRVDLDVRPYKMNTLRRRIHRRMGLNQIASRGDYLRFLRENAEEVDRLARDLLISVTEFFRDPGAFERLRRSVAPGLVRAAVEREELRIWVPGCATGEEAYSLSILFLDAMRDLEVEVPLTIFATDIDPEAIRRARNGVYTPGSLAHLPASLREQYFKNADGHRLRVAKPAREPVSFAVHDLLKEAPFSRIDLLSCRNLLIYLRREVQKEVMNLFHFSLRPEGVLFLGSSETPAAGPDMFQAIASDERIYRRVGHDRGRIRLPLSRTPRRSWAVERVPEGWSPPPAARSMKAAAQEALLGGCVPAAVVVDSEQKILYLHGDLSPYLDLPRGEMDADLVKLLKENLRTRVRAALYKVLREDEPLTVRAYAEGPDGSRRVRVTLSPAHTAGAQGLYTLLFEDVPGPAKGGAEAPPTEDETMIRQLESELESTREDLRNTIEELETSNEELKSSNEETMSMNEELQSANEELEASSEELRSLNEELSTVNAQLREKVVEVEEARNDIANFLVSTRVATIFLGPDLRIRRFTPAAARLIGLDDGDIGRPVGGALRGFGDETLPVDVHKVLDTLAQIEIELSVSGDHVLRRRVLPYRTEDDRIDGVVVVYTDVTELSRALDRVERRAERQAIVSELGLQALRGGKLETILQRAAERVVGALGAPFCKILEVLPGTEEMLVRAGVGWKEDVVGLRRVGIDADSPGGFTLRSIETVMVNDLDTDDRFRENSLLREHGVRSGLSCVIEGPSGPWGVLGVYSREKERFDAADAAFVQSVANVLGTVIQRQRWEQALLDSEARIRLLTDSLPVLISYLDRDLRYRFHNREYRRWFDLDAEEIEGRHVREVLGEQAWERLRPRAERALAGETVTGEEELPLLRGGPRTVNVTYVPDRHEASGEVRGLYALILDVTDRRKMEAELRLGRERLAAHAERLEEADRNKDKFLAILGHELRNPLGAIVNALRILDGEGKGFEGRRAWALRVISEQAESMTRLLNDLLDVSRISRGKLSLKIENLSLAAVLSRAIDGVRPALKKKRLMLSFDEDRARVRLTGDRIRLEQVFMNLLSNAARYTPEEGEVEVLVETEDHEVRVHVRDDGIGLSEEEIEQIFDPFFQADGADLGETGGLGIGLTLVRQIVNLHEGRIEASSRGPGRGATFTVILPRTASEEERRPSPANFAEDAPPLTILVVDDNEDAADALALVLEAAGHRVFRARDGAGAVEAARENRPDVVLLDIGLPDLDGCEVAKRIQADVENPPHLVAVTGFGDSESARRVREAGFDRHLLKPVDFEQLDGILREAAGERPASAD